MSKREDDPGYSDTWCIHFRDASRNVTCKAGVRYSSFPQPRFKTQPCFLKQPGEKAPCEHLRVPTPEEVEAHEALVDRRIGQLRTVMTGIAPWRAANKGKNTQAVVACPACQGRLHLSISSYNNHVHGRCETDGCVSWME